MIINRQIRAEKILNSGLQNCEKFNFDEYCNYFRFQNDVVLRIIIKNNGIGSAKSTFFSTLNSFNNYIIRDNFLGVLAIVYYEDGTDNTVIEANFNQRWDKKDDIIELAFDFLCCIPELDYDLEKFPVKNIKKYFYEKALNKSLIVSNIFFKIYSLFSTPIRSISAPERLTFDGITFKLSTALSVKHSENVHSPIKSS